MQLDNLDIGILTAFQKDCRTSLEQIAKDLGVPKSTIHYRIKRLEEKKIIEGYYAKVNNEKLGKNFLTITLARAKYGPHYYEKAGKKIENIPGVWAVYFIFGENDLLILSRSKNRDEYLQKLDEIMKIPEIERTNTLVVAKVLKEDIRSSVELED
ncbi:MAG: Lrp/AsnC family transcriptional regulator [Promethearchaeota archaeon]